MQFPPQSPLAIVHFLSVSLWVAVLVAPRATLADTEFLEMRQLASQYVDATRDTARQQGEQTQARKQMQALQGEGKRYLGLPLVTANEGALQLSARLVNQTWRDLLDSQQEILTTRRRETQELLQHWRQMREERAALEELLFQARGNRQLVTQLGFLVSFDNRWIWVGGLFTIGGLCILVFHERRREVRKFWLGAGARSPLLFRVLYLVVLFLASAVAITFTIGSQLHDWLVLNESGQESSPRAELEKLYRQRRAEDHDARTALRETLEQIAQVRGANGKNVDQSEESGGRWAQWLSGQRALAGEANVALRLSEEIHQDGRHLEELHRQVGNNAVAAKAFHLVRARMRAALAMTLFGAGLTFGLIFLLGMQVRDTHRLATCPMCQGSGKLQWVGDAKTVREVLCTHELDGRHQCGFRYVALYQRMEKRAFPTLGAVQSGKTHWVAMLYRELNRGNYPDCIHFEKLRATSASQTEYDFDKIARDILEEKMEPQATQHDRLPHPLIFNFRDHDSLGASNVLVNIFDYSGEVTQNQTLQDFQRHRMLNGDGFFLFLDPTRSSSVQAEILTKFREDLRLSKRVAAGRQVKVPVALCISKIDLLLIQKYARHGTDVLRRFYEELREIDETTAPLSWRRLQERSYAVARLRETIWPGWQIERTIRDLFGARFLFFPLTPVGISDLDLDNLHVAELQELRDRTIAPYAILEPLLWLLEMNGFRVLR